MKKTFTYLALLSAILFSCHSKDKFSLLWSDSLVLPAPPGTAIQPGVAGPFTGIYDDYLIIAGGANFPDRLPWDGGVKVYHKDVFIFQREDSNWNYKGSYTMPVELGYGATISSKKNLICIGGENSKGISSGVFSMRFAGEPNQLSFTPYPSLPIPLTNLSAVMTDNTIYVAGGVSTDGVSGKMFSLNLSDENQEWKELASLPKPVSHFVMVVLGKDIYCIGGRAMQSDGISELYNTVYAYNIQEDQWAEKPALPFALSAGTGIALDDNRILLFGGDKGETFHQTELLIQAINNEKDRKKKEELTQQKNDLQKSHPGFSRDILMFDKRTQKWETIGTIPYNTPVTTTVLKYNNSIILPSGEIRAGIRTTTILTADIKPD